MGPIFPVSSERATELGQLQESLFPSSVDHETLMARKGPVETITKDMTEKKIALVSILPTFL